jgi:hypothetical protein
LRYWYLPVAAALAAGVAYGIVALADWIVGDPDSAVEPAASTTVFAQTPLPTAAGTTATTDASASTTPSPPVTTATLAAGTSVTVTGTGDCLNLRAEPSTDATVLTCIPDGTNLVLAEGPQPLAGRNWWRVEFAGNSGWVAEEYLRPR